MRRIRKILMNYYQVQKNYLDENIIFSPDLDSNHFLGENPLSIDSTIVKLTPLIEIDPFSIVKLLDF